MSIFNNKAERLSVVGVFLVLAAASTVNRGIEYLVRLRSNPQVVNVQRGHTSNLMLASSVKENPNASKQKDSLEEKISKYTIGNTDISLRLVQKEGSPVTYFNMHDNENTSTKAAEKVIKQYGGRLIELKHSGKRNIIFSLNGKSYQFDPNRIFTDVGIKETLKRYGHFNKDAFNEVKEFREWLFDTYSLKDSKALVTIHNNLNKGSCSVKDYSKRSENPATDVDDFILVTNEKQYKALSNSNYNVAMQSAKSAIDDGSLLIHWDRELKRPYINVEAQHGHVKQQVDMLEKVKDLYKGEKGFLIPPKKKEVSESKLYVQPHKTYTVQDDDRTWNIVKKEYGKVNIDIISKLTRYNAKLGNEFNPEKIKGGLKIYLPPIETLLK